MEGGVGPGGSEGPAAGRLTSRPSRAGARAVTPRRSPGSTGDRSVRERSVRSGGEPAVAVALVPRHPEVERLATVARRRQGVGPPPTRTGQPAASAVPRPGASAPAAPAWGASITTPPVGSRDPSGASRVGDLRSATLARWGSAHQPVTHQTPLLGDPRPLGVRGVQAEVTPVAPEPVAPGLRPPCGGPGWQRPEMGLPPTGTAVDRPSCRRLRRAGRGAAARRPGQRTVESSCRSGTAPTGADATMSEALLAHPAAGRGRTSNAGSRANRWAPVMPDAARQGR